MSKLKALLIFLLLLSGLKVEALPSTEIRLKSLESDIDAIREQTLSLALRENLMQDRLHEIEQSLDKLKNEIYSLKQQLQSLSSQSLSPVSGHSSSDLEAIKSWQHQTDRNINHLQQGLQALASALGKPSLTKEKKSNREPFKESHKAGSQEIVYTVKSGDSLERIARRHHTTQQAIIDLNNLKSTVIQIGQKLKLPQASS